MPAKAPEPLQKKTLNLRAGDWDFLDSIYHDKDIKTSGVIRTAVSTLVDNIKAQEKPLEQKETGELSK